MNVTYERCCGLDIHKKTVVACLLTPHTLAEAEGQSQANANQPHQPHKEIRTFGTMTQDILDMADWLSAAGCTHVAMESTGVYWKPIYNLLEGYEQFELLVVNAAHIKAVPGRKTDVKDSEWIADLLRHGLLRGSFIPDAPQRELRELTRHRITLVRERARIVNRLQKVLEDANIKLASVATDIMGASGKAMLEALVGGQTDPSVLADLAKGRLRDKDKHEALTQALQGRFKAHHRFMIAQHLGHIDYLDEAIERVSAEIEERVGPFVSEGELEALDSVTGIGIRAAQVLVGEIGTNMNRFPSARHLASWAGICPGNKQSGGKRMSGKTTKGSPWLRQVLMEAAHGAAHTKHTYLAALYHRIAARRGRKRALVAVAHAILVIVYHVLLRKQSYQELGGDYFDERERQMIERRAVRRLEQLGYRVQLQPIAQPQAA
jgi:transposase